MMNLLHELLLMLCTDIQKSLLTAALTTLGVYAAHSSHTSISLIL